MWNKLFKKREKVTKPGHSAKINSKLEPKTTTNCFSFRKKYPSDGLTPSKSGNFQYLKYQSQIYGQGIKDILIITGKSYRNGLFNIN